MLAVADSSGAAARLRLFGNGHLHIYGHNRPGFTIGSLEGDGGVYLGDPGAPRGRTLIVGNKRNTTFSGFLDDRGSTGSLTKIGKGSLTLTYANTYLGGTLVKQGQLLVSNTTGSGTGSGPVQVNRGRLGGTGMIAGAITVGTGTGSGAIVAPGASDNGIGTLTTESSLLCHADASYQFDIDTDLASADQLVASGVTIDAGATFSPTGIGTGTLSNGTAFTIINNTSENPISGVFANLVDGSTVAIGTNTFQADYEGGDGNDLTLTVVP